MTGQVGKRWRTVALVQGLSFSLEKPALQLSGYSILERAKELNDSHLSAVYILGFKMSLFPELLAMTRLIVDS